MRASYISTLIFTALALALPARGAAQGTASADSARAGQVPPGGAGGSPRMRLQRQIRQEFTRAVRTQVGLTDDQMRKLAPINQQYVAQRQALARQERDARMALRAELVKEEPDQAKVADYSAQLQAIPHKRLDLNDAEARELSTIMTPVQLAKFRALEERVQRQMNAMRGRRGDGMGPPGSGGLGRRGGGSGGGR
ncbi:MAG TPA: hypothetical protein VMV51_15470 [Gemmatimonadaceae bacterium]|nr:hypothetical protein [Gemmatimonadaceae bacterium]